MFITFIILGFIIYKLIHKNNNLLINNHQLEKDLALSEAKLTNINKLQSDTLDMKKQLEKQFEHITLKLLNTGRKETQGTITEILAPFKEKLEQFNKKAEHLYAEEAKERFSLKNEIKNIIAAQEFLHAEASKLNNALTNNNKAQGNWGEYQLQNLLEYSGLKKDIDFITQVHATNDSGNLLRPDVVINLPNKRHIIIDAKVSLLAYYKSINSNDMHEKAHFNQEFIASVLKQINDLSSKEYYRSNELNSIDFVIMFMPIESAYISLVNSHPEIINTASKKNISLTCPSTLMSTLQSIVHFIQSDKQNKNALAIAEESGKMYDKFVNFVTDLKTIDKSLTSSQSSLQNAITKLHTGRGNLVSKAEKIKELGSKVTKELQI